jgi:hypothetical protein
MALSRRSPSDPYQIATIFVAGEKKEIKLCAATMRKSTFDYSRTAIPTLPSNAAPAMDDRCAAKAGKNSRLLGSDTVLGFQAFRYESRSGGENGRDYEERITWYAPGLNCYTVRLDAVKKSPDGTVLGNFQRAPLNVTLGVPADSFFSSEAYEEVLPSVLERGAFIGKLDADRANPAAKEGALKRVQVYFDRLDAKYRSLRADP